MVDGGWEHKGETREQLGRRRAEPFAQGRAQCPPPLGLPFTAWHLARKFA
jgi:hypothetical protein